MRTMRRKIWTSDEDGDGDKDGNGDKYMADI